MWGGIVRLAGHEAAIEIGDPVGLDGKGGLRGNAGVSGELLLRVRGRIL
jgi:hypothetical protein